MIDNLLWQLLVYIDCYILFPALDFPLLLVRLPSAMIVLLLPSTWVFIARQWASMAVAASRRHPRENSIADVRVLSAHANALPALLREAAAVVGAAVSVPHELRMPVRLPNF